MDFVLSLLALLAHECKQCDLKPAVLVGCPSQITFLLGLEDPILSLSPPPRFPNPISRYTGPHALSNQSQGLKTCASRTLALPGSRSLQDAGFERGGTEVASEGVPMAAAAARSFSILPTQFGLAKVLPQQFPSSRQRALLPQWILAEQDAASVASSVTRGFRRAVVGACGTSAPCQQSASPQTG